MILSLLFTPFLSSALDQAPISFQLLTEIKEAKRGISEVKFSPDGATLGVGARDNSIYLYSTSQQFKRRAKFSKHNAGINQFDFSADGKAIQSCCRCVRVVCACVCGVCVCVCMLCECVSLCVFV
jgi:WD40 repeat protein